jgi:hypothetical protein
VLDGTARCKAVTPVQMGQLLRRRHILSAPGDGRARAHDSDLGDSPDLEDEGTTPDAVDASDVVVIAGSEEDDVQLSQSSRSSRSGSSRLLARRGPR